MANRKRILVTNLEIGMVLADDVLSSTGLMLIPKGTIINEKQIFRLKLYQIYSVYIEENYNSEDNYESEQHTIKPKSEIISTLNKTFDKFKDNYNEQEVVFKEKLTNISNGEPINISDLLTISSSLVSSIRTKSDLFNYLYQLKNNDDITFSHCLNVSILCNIFANWLKMSKQQVEEVTIAGLLHDIGKTKIDSKILNKPGKLTEEEFEEVKKHSRYSYDLIKSQNISTDIKMGILLHHEKIDGSGYPLGLKGSDIHDYAKIIAITDIYDAMTSNRSYHKKFSPFTVIQMFEQESYGLLDTKFLFVFLENIAHNYLGRDVLLSTGEEAKVMFIHNNSPSRPIVQVDNSMIDLMYEPSITIEEIL